MARILVTRPQSQSGPLIESIQAQGDEVVAMPLLSIQALTSPAAKEAIKQRILQLADYQHVIFISTNAVHNAWQWMDMYWPQLPIRQQWYAIGNATADAITALGVEAEQAGVSMNSESLLSHADLQNLDYQKVLIFRGLGGREHLKNALEQRGAQVDYCEVYQRQNVSYEKGYLASILSDKLDILTITSSETIQRLLDQAIIDKVLNNLLQLPLIAPGERLHKIALDEGFQQVYKAENAGLVAMQSAIDAIKNNNK